MNTDASPTSDVTHTLARYVVNSRFADLPEGVRHEGRRALLNWLGCALGGCGEVSVQRLCDALRPFFGPAQATLVGLGERCDVVHAAMVNAQASNILDYDDTHLATVIHPSVPVASAVLPLAERLQASGADLLHAFILGVEVECRIGNAICPWHYEHGWQVTARDRKSTRLNSSH